MKEIDMPTALTRRRIDRPGTASRQRGAVLFIALIVLVAMTLAGIAAVRSVDTTVQIAGNLAFKQSTTFGGDRAIETARTWLVAQTAFGALFADITANGYFAATPTTGPGLETAWRNYDWTNLSLPVAGTDAAGNSARFVIHRLCNQTGDPNVVATGISCLTSLTTTSSASSKGAGRSGVAGSSLNYYRVTARVTGPRNTISYVQTMVEL
jgi:Tfp pilus assembly protein PilX